TVAARCRALQSCRTRLTLDVWVLLSGGRAVVMLDYCLGLQLRDCLALAAAVNRAVAGQAGSDLLVTLTQEGCCYLAHTTLLCQHLQRLTQGGPRPLLLHFPPPQAAAGSLQPQLLPAAAAQVLLAGLSSLVQALQPDLPQHTPAPSLAHALPTTGPASTQLPPTSCTALDLGALPDLPPMPTLNGLLLGYPCVYVVEGSREQAQQAASTLSCTPLALLKLLAPPPQQLMQAMQAMQARVGGFGKNGVDAEGAGIVGSQGRDDYNYDDVEQYFNYMGFLAEEGTYDRMEALLASGLHPIDIILILACSENDTPKIGEILRAGADVRAKGLDGRTPLQIATKPEVLNLLKEYEAKAAAKA
ncbi:ANK_REP_REGION domain-containing protein, partial [Haematococcus lacustris]